MFDKFPEYPSDSLVGNKASLTNFEEPSKFFQITLLMADRPDMSRKEALVHEKIFARPKSLGGEIAPDQFEF